MSVRSSELQFHEDIDGQSRQRNDPHFFVLWRPRGSLLRRVLANDANFTLLEIDVAPSQVEHLAQP